MLQPNKDYYFGDVVVCNSVYGNKELGGQKTGVVKHIGERIIRLQDINGRNFKVYKEDVIKFVRRGQRIEDIVEIDTIEKELGIAK